jgi:8-oxo-dGTP diphosphatase
MEMKKIVASGPVIIENGKLLATKEGEDDFYKIPGGGVEGKENAEETCLREFNEETGLSCRIIKKLSTMKLDKNPQTGEKMIIELHHYQCELTDSSRSYKQFEYNGHQVKWLDIKEIKQGKYPVAPNIKFLIERGEIK